MTEKRKSPVELAGYVFLVDTTVWTDAGLPYPERDQIMDIIEAEIPPDVMKIKSVEGSSGGPYINGLYAVTLEIGEKNTPSQAALHWMIFVMGELLAQMYKESL